MALAADIISFYTACTVYISNIKITNLTTYSGAILFMKDIEGTLSDLVMINHFTEVGPSLSFVNIANPLICRNLTFITNGKDHSIILGKLAVFWSSVIEIYNLTANDLVGKGLFDLQFYSNITVKLINFSNSICSTFSKGCIIFSDSRSVIALSVLIVNMTKTFNSLIYLENSSGNFSNITFNLIEVNKLTVDQCLLMFDSSNATLMFFSVTNINSLFLYGGSSNLQIISCFFDNTYLKTQESIQHIPELFGIAYIYFYQSLQNEIINSSFVKLGGFAFGVFNFH